MNTKNVLRKKLEDLWRLITDWSITDHERAGAEHSHHRNPTTATEYKSLVLGRGYGLDAQGLGEDIMGDFLAERCVLAPEARVSRPALRSAYEAWCAEVGAKPPLGAKAFAERLRERGFEGIVMRVLHESSPTRGWQGIRLRVPADDGAPATDGGDVA